MNGSPGQVDDPPSANEARTDFALAFAGPCILKNADGEPVTIRTERLGLLATPSGSLGLGDPLVNMDHVAPPGELLPPGPHPVDLCVARFPNGDERVAVARIRFAGAPAVKWEHSGAGAGVDSGTAGFCDGAGIAYLDDEPAGEALLAALEAGERAPTWHVAVIKVGGVDVIAFSSGWGDGLYSGLWGRSAAGDIVELVLDFDLLVTPITEPIPIGARPGRGSFAHPTLKAAGARAWVPWLGRRRLTIASGKQFVYPRWKLPDGSLSPLQGKPTWGRRWSYQVEPPAPDAELWLFVTRGYRPMTP